MPVIERSAVKLGRDFGLVPARMALGASMVFHGYGKLAGEGPKKTGQMFEQLGIQPGKHWGIATGLAEVFAGAGALLGLWTRPAAIAVLVTQGVALAKVHAKNGYDITKGGYEYNVALMAIAAAMLAAGPGRFSTHELLEHAVEGRGARGWLNGARPGWFLRLLKLVK